MAIQRLKLAAPGPFDELVPEARCFSPVTGKQQRRAAIDAIRSYCICGDSTTSDPEVVLRDRYPEVTLYSVCASEVRADI